MRVWRLGLDPRAKLLLCLALGAALVRLEPMGAIALAWLVLSLAALALGQGRAYLRWLALTGGMALSWFVIAWLAFDLPTALTASLRLLALTTLFFLLFRTTAPEDLGNALVKWGLPYPVAFVMSAALQFVPVLGRRAQHVVDAQRSRGLRLEPGLAALRLYPALLVPMLIQAFQMAEDLAEAMESRGFNRPGRTFLQEYRMRGRDWAAVGMGALTIAAVWLM